MTPERQKLLLSLANEEVASPNRTRKLASAMKRKGIDCSFSQNMTMEEHTDFIDSLSESDLSAQ